MDKIQELKKALENVEGFTLKNFHRQINIVYVKLEKKAKSGYLIIKEKFIETKDIDREIKIAKSL